MALGFKFLDDIFHGNLQDETQFNKYFYYLGIHFLKRKKSMCLSSRDGMGTRGFMFRYQELVN